MTENTFFLSITPMNFSIILQIKKYFMFTHTHKNINLEEQKINKKKIYLLVYSKTSDTCIEYFVVPVCSIHELFSFVISVGKIVLNVLKGNFMKYFEIRLSRHLFRNLQ